MVSSTKKDHIQYEFDISLLLELSKNEGPHLRVFCPCIRRWTYHKPQVEVPPGLPSAASLDS